MCAPFRLPAASAAAALGMPFGSEVRLAVFAESNGSRQLAGIDGPVDLERNSAAIGRQRTGEAHCIGRNRAVQSARRELSAMRSHQASAGLFESDAGVRGEVIE